MQFNQILTEEMYNQHQLWLQNYNTAIRLELINANLSGADLTGANLSDANLYSANLSDANLSSANLSNTTLSYSNLYNSYLSGADLRCAYLYSVDLRYANLSNANLSRAKLRRANLSDADLTGANITDANITFCKPDGIRIKRISLPKYNVNILDNHTIAIGCQQHHIDLWKSFSDDQIDQMDDDALQWWNTHKTTIFNFIEEQNNAI
jgi:hypothetical protein